MTLNSQLYGPPSPNDLKQIDATARRILAHVGIRIVGDEFLNLLGDAGAQVDRETSRVRFSEDWLDQQVALAPSKFILCSRDGQNDVRLGEGRVHFSSGGRVFRLMDMATGGHRSTMLRDVAHTAALVDRLDYIGMYIIACQAHDVPPEHYHLNDFFAAMNHTTKHVMGGCDNLAGVKQVWELAGMIAGGEDRLRERPFVSVITNPISPLTIESTTLSILRFCCTHGLPATCAPAPIAGATAPATLAGTLAQMHAEALAGVAIAQVFKAGAPVLYGAVPTAMDLRTAEFTMGSAEMAIMNGWAVHLSKLYNLPIYGSAGVTESKTPDVQAGVEKTFSFLTTALAGADLIHLAAGMLDSGNSISYEQYVIDNEIIGMVYRLLSGVTVNEQTLAGDVIERVGPGGNYVMDEHTLEHMMTEFYYPQLAVRRHYDIWQELGRPGMLTRAHEVVESVLDETREGVLDNGLVYELHKNFMGLMQSQANP
jgi:trimethylamine--corrinoid protein Co-methyltransferase